MKVRWSYERIEPPYWDDKTVAIIGGGTSLKGSALERLKGKVHALAVKGTIWDHPWADNGFGLDAGDLHRWWRKLNTAQMEVYWAVGSNWREPSKFYFPRHLHLVHRESQTGLSDNPEVIHSGGSSGYGALNFAYLKKARKIVLFGFDYGPTGGVWHANERHYSPSHLYDVQDWTVWAGNFEDAVADLRRANVEVINASPSSLILAFPKMTVEEGILECLK